MERFVADRERVEGGIEVADRGVDVDGLDRVAGQEVGALATEPKAMWGPPISNVWAGFRAWSLKVAGAVVIRSSTMSGSNRTLGPSPSTVAPAACSSRRASASRKSIPMSRRMRSEARWMESSSSSETTSVGRRRIVGWAHGRCSGTGPGRAVSPPRRPRRRAATTSGWPPAAPDPAGAGGTAVGTVALAASLAASVIVAPLCPAVSGTVVSRIDRPTPGAFCSTFWYHSVYRTKLAESSGW